MPDEQLRIFQALYKAKQGSTIEPIIEIGLNVEAKISRAEGLRKAKMRAQISEHLLRTYGPVLGADVLWQVLSFKSRQAFNRSLQRGATTLPLFRPKGRDGVYVLAPDLAEHLVALSETSLIQKDEPASTN